jgi:mono/diheme cytochrome c family protein
VPLLFQALDDRGQAVQVMRSATYLQPGETASCAGCHEPRTTGPAPAPAGVPDVRALARPPSRIEPGPAGSRPFSYPLLVQAVLDRHCVRCHSGEKPPKGIVLTGEAEGHYTRSYNALAARVPSSNDTNGEALSLPGRYGARGSPVMRMLLDPSKPHNKVALSPQEIERLATWMDTNALFYGTFDPADQARQQKGEKIVGPKLE